MQKELPAYATHGPLNNSYFAYEASHTRHTQSPNEKKKKIATFLLRRSCPVGTRGSRALHHENPAHETKETPPRSTKQKASLFAPLKRTLLTKPLSSRSSLRSTSVCFELRLLSTPVCFELRLLSTLSSASTHALLSSEAPPPWPASRSLVPCPFWACLLSLSANRESGHALRSST